MKMLTVLLRIVAVFCEIVVAFFAVIFVISLVGMAFSTRDVYKPAENGITIYLRTDGTHTDFVLPVKHAVCDWSTMLPFENVATPDTTRDWVSFGWGNKNFFLNTKEWKDLTVATAMKAAFYVGGSAIHNVYLYQPEKTQDVKEIKISQRQYLALVEFIKDSYVLTKTNDYSCISKAGYWENDVFYNAHGKYGVLNTCNTWINNGLKAAELPACQFTPFAYGIMRNYAIVN